MMSTYGGIWFLANDHISDGDKTTHVTCFGIKMTPGTLPETATDQKWASLFVDHPHGTGYLLW